MWRPAGSLASKGWPCRRRARTILVLSDEVAEAVASGTFHIWSVVTADEAIELFTGVPAGEPDAEGQYPADSVYGRVMVQLEAFDRILTERGRA